MEVARNWQQNSSSSLSDFRFLAAATYSIQVLDEESITKEPYLTRKVEELPAPSAVKAWSANHWTAREFPQPVF